MHQRGRLERDDPSTTHTVCLQVPEDDPHQARVLFQGEDVFEL